MGKTSVEVTVRGSHSVRVRPERATVHATLSGEGPAAEPVFQMVTTSLGAITNSVETLHHSKRGPITRYVIDQVRLGSHRPWNADGKQLPLVHTASVSIVAEFTDFEKLADWVAGNAGLDGLSIGHIEWSLTDTRRLDVERRTRQKAVRDANRRAQDYADALDLGPVRVCRISDPGLGEPPQQKVFLARSMAVPADGAPQFELRPQDVEIAAEVEATFTVRP